MSKYSPTNTAIMNLLRERGMNFLEIEQAFGIPDGLNRIDKLRRQGLIESLPKERGQLKRYHLTAQGAKAIGLHLQEQARLARPSVMDLPTYTPPAFVCARAGAMDAFTIRSRGMRA